MSLAFVLLFILFFLLSDRRVPIYDGGLPLSLALRVLHGEVPHRDFYYQYGPAQPFVFATLFRIFGVRLLPVTVVELLVRSAIVLAGFAVVRRVSSSLVAACAAGMVGLLLLVPYPSAGIDALLFVVLFIHLSGESFLIAPSGGRAFAVGLLCGAAGMFRYEQGPMLLVLYGLLLLIGWWLRGDRMPFRAAALALAGYLVLTLPLALYLAVHGALSALWYQCFTFARLYYRAARELPFPGDFWHLRNTVLYAPLVIPPLVLAYLGWLLWRERGKLRSARATLLFLLSTLALFYALKGSIRVDFGQMLSGNLAVALLLGVFTGTAGPRLLRGLAAVAGVFVLLSLLLDLRTRIKGTWSAQELVLQSVRHATPTADIDGWCASRLPLTSSFCFSTNRDHEQAVSYIAQRVSPGDRIYVGLAHHDTIYAGDNLTYFATNTLPAVKWSHFDPDLQNRADVQREMINDLERNRPRFAMETSQYEGNSEPNDSSKSSGVFLLDQYLQGHYKAVAAYGPFTVLQLRSGQSQ